MHEEWPDIPGVTESDGRPRLPRDPSAVARALAEALEGDLSLADLVERAHRSTREERGRLEGLAGWLPLSGVAWWDESGRLGLNPWTDLQDLCVRYAAWVGSQPIRADQVEQVMAYTRGVVDAARAIGPMRPARPSARPAPSDAVASAPTEAPLVPPELTDRLRAILGALDAAFLERRRHVRATLLALLAGQHALLLGPPGTAKSLLARALCGCFRDATYFEYLLSRFTHPDELFGPISIPGLKEEDYRRLTQGFLPQAHVAFLDEIFKANSAILNSLLTLVNERVFHHGRHRDAVPLIGLVGASNELPDPEGGLSALYDRFLVRLAVPPLASREAFLAVATGTVPEVVMPEGARLGPDDLALLRAAADAVEVPPDVAALLVVLWQQAGRREWDVSDRRWRQAVGMLKVGVAADGRRRLAPVDLLLLEPVLAPSPDRSPEVHDALLELLRADAVPRHDLRTQWTLLRADRVAPTHEQPRVEHLPPDATWDARLAARRASVGRFLWHHERAVRGLAADRSRLEAVGDRHLWLAELPVELLSRHIEAARDLARILRLAEGYRGDVSSAAKAAAALLRALPTTRRVYGSSAVVALRVTDGSAAVGLTVSGERVEPVPDRLPEVCASAAELLDWADGRRTDEALAHDLPSWAGRDALTALGAARRLLGAGLPRPPELPQP